jgi:hypothetical protein
LLLLLLLMGPRAGGLLLDVVIVLLVLWSTQGCPLLLMGHPVLQLCAWVQHVGSPQHLLLEEQCLWVLPLPLLLHFHVSGALPAGPILLLLLLGC